MITGINARAGILVTLAADERNPSSARLHSPRGALPLDRTDAVGDGRARDKKPRALVSAVGCQPLPRLGAWAMAPSPRAASSSLRSEVAGSQAT